MQYHLIKTPRTAGFFVFFFLYLFHSYVSVMCELRNLIFRSITGEQLENTYVFFTFKFQSLYWKEAGFIVCVCVLNAIPPPKKKKNRFDPLIYK